MVVFGHSHQALIERQDSVLYLNPGSAGPRRFRLPVTVARLHIAARMAWAMMATGERYREPLALAS